MKKIILTLTVSVLLTQIFFAQENNTSPKNFKKKYAISCGATYNIPFNYWGGNFKIDYLIGHKLGLGLKAVATPCKFYNYTAHLNYYTATYTSGLVLITDLTLTYYLFGDYFKSKGGMYTDLGFGYNIAKSNSNIQFGGFPTTKGYDSYSGFGGHLSLGGSYKLRSGKIYLEAMLGSLIKGTFTRSVPFPDGYPYLGGFSYKKSRDLYGDLLGFNLGYCF